MRLCFSCAVSSTAHFLYGVMSLKKGLSVLLALSMTLLMLPTGNMISFAASSVCYSNFYDAAYDSDPGQYMVNIAFAQEGRTGADLDYSADWCAWFIADCARYAGQIDAFASARGRVDLFIEDIISAGGYEVSISDAKAGDVVYVDWPNSGYEWDHVEMVVKSYGSTVNTIGGNSGTTSATSNKYRYRKVVNHDPLNGYNKIKIYRPNYSNTAPTSAPTYAYLSASSEVVSVGESITFSMQSDYATNYLIGIDHHSASGAWLERVITQGISDGWSIDSLPVGYYSAYVTGWNQQGSVDSNRVYFSVDPIGHYINIGNWVRGTFLTYPNWKNLINGDNSNVYIDQEIGSAREVWRFTRNDDGSYKIQNEKDGKCLQVENGSSSPGANVVVGEDDGSASQRWFIYSADEGGYILRPKCSSSVLDLQNNNNAYGTNITVWTYYGGDAQKYIIYQGDDVLLCASTLSVNDSTPLVQFSWDNVPGETFYRIRIYDSKNQLVHENWKIENSSYALTLPKGNYQAVVHAYNYFVGYDSNTVSFTAKESTYTISFNANNGSCPTTNKTVTYNSAYGDLPIATRSGYDFLGWFTAEAGGTMITSDSIVTITSNQTLFAHWEKRLVLGDTDGDGDIGLKDVVQITRYLAGGWDVTVDLTAADVNKDGEVNLKDAVLLRRYLAGGWGVQLA